MPPLQRGERLLLARVRVRKYQSGVLTLSRVARGSQEVEIEEERENRFLLPTVDLTLFSLCHRRRYLLVMGRHSVSLAHPPTHHKSRPRRS